MRPGGVFRAPLGNFSRLTDDRFRERMLAALFQRRRKRQQFSFVLRPSTFAVFSFVLRTSYFFLVVGVFANGEDTHDLRLAGGNCAGLVEDDNLRPPCGLKGGGGLEENAVPCADAASNHNRDRRREAEGARTTHDEHRNRAGEGESGLDAAGKPDAERDERDKQDGRNENCRHAVREACDWRLGRGGVLHEAHNLREGGVLPHPRRAAAQEARDIRRGGGDGRTRRLVDGNAFAREGRLVDGAFALVDNAVDRNVLAGTDEEDVADTNLRGGNLGFASVTHDGRRLGREAQQGGEGARGPALGMRFEKLADRDERDNHRGALEVVLPHPRLGGGRTAKHLRARHEEEDGDAPGVGRARAECDERVHVRRAM